LPAHGLGGTRATLLFPAAHFAKRNTKFGGGGKRGRAKIPGGRPLSNPLPFCPPERLVWRAKRAINSVQNRFGFGQIIAPQSNFQEFCRLIRPREARQRTKTLARRARRGSPSAGSKSLAILTRATFILSNPFYTGLFRYSKELHEGKHEPIIVKKIFDKVQEVLKQRGRPRHKSVIEPQVFCGLLHCATCGMMITGEYRVKKQKNGNVHDYIYYHCTKKNKSVKCLEPCIRQEELDKQISSLLQKFSLRLDWAEKLLEMAEVNKEQSAQSVSVFVQESQIKIRAINQKLQRLLDGYLEQDIEREIYREQKTKLLLEKKSLDEKMARIEQKQNDWLEPMKEWIKVATNLVKIARDSNLLEKKVVAKEIFGSNLRLASRAVRGEPVFPYLSALRAAESIGKIPESLIVVPFV